MKEDNQSPKICDKLRKPHISLQPQGGSPSLYIVDATQFVLSRPKLDRAIFQLRVGNQDGLRKWHELLEAYSRTKLKSRKRGKKCYSLCNPWGLYTGRDIRYGLVQVDFQATRENLRIFQSLVENYFGYRGIYLQIHEALFLTSVEVSFDFYPIGNPVDEDEDEPTCIELSRRIAWRMVPIRLINPYSKSITSTQKHKHTFENGIRSHYIQSCKRKYRDLPMDEMKYNPNASLGCKIYVKQIYDKGYFVRVEGTFSKYKRKKELPLNWRNFTNLQDIAEKFEIVDLWKFIDVDYSRFIHDFSDIIQQDPSMEYDVIATQGENACNKIMVMKKVLRMANYKRTSEIIMRYIRKMNIDEAISTPVPINSNFNYQLVSITDRTNMVKKIKTREKIRNAMRKKKSA